MEHRNTLLRLPSGPISVGLNLSIGLISAAALSSCQMPGQASVSQQTNVAPEPPALQTAQTPSAIAYQYSAQDKQITATVNVESFVLIDLMTPTPSHLFLGPDQRQGNPAAEFLSGYENGLAFIEQVGDFDQNGMEDALVGFSVGGNCCAPGYAILSVLDDGSFRLSPLIDWAWNAPQMIEHNGRQAFETRTDNQIYVHAYESGQVILLDERIIQEKQAIAQLRADEVIAGTSPASLVFDLDDNGTLETLSCEVWDRWQSLLCQLDHADGTVIQDFSVGCDRYGILPTMTNNMHDIVCNEQQVAQWNGDEYVWDER